MLRRGIQFEITKYLQSLNSNDAIVSFLTVLGTELRVNNVNSFLVKAFVNIKHQLSNESLDNILQWLKDNSIEKNTNNHKLNAKSTSNTELKIQSQLPCQLATIPNDIFCHIGSHLSYTDTIHLSQTSHLFHKKINHKSYFNPSHSYAKLNLTESKIAEISKISRNSSTANLLCYKWKEVVFDHDTENPNDDDNKIIHCDKNNKCSFCRLVEQAADENNINNCNYDLKWFANMLSNVRDISLSNNWPCLWNKMPLQWLLKGDANTSVNCIRAVDSSIDDSNGRAFADNYESYFINKCGSDIKKIRKISGIRYCSSLYYCLPKMHQNYTDIAYAVLDHDTNQLLKCQTFSQFLQIFHENVESILLGIMDNPSNNIINNNSDKYLCQMFFDESSDIYKDLIKDESVLSLKSFKSKYNINCNNDSNSNSNNSNMLGLPCIDSLEIFAFPNHITGNVLPFTGLLQLFQHSKLMTVLNFKNSVTKMELGSFGSGDNAFNYKYLSEIFDIILNDFNQIKEICISLANLENCNDEFSHNVELFFNQLYFQQIIYKILYCFKTKKNDKLVNFNTLKMQWKPDVRLSPTPVCRIVKTVSLNDIETPYTHSCQQKATLVSDKILKLIPEQVQKQLQEKENYGIELKIKFDRHLKL